MHINLLRHGFILILLALVTGLVVPAMQIPRLAVSAHTIAVLGGVLLIAVGTCWSVLRLTHIQSSILVVALLVSSYGNWLACLAGAMLGAGTMTPVASAGVTASPSAESLVSVMLVAVVISSFIAVALCLWGLRPGLQSAHNA